MRLGDVLLLQGSPEHVSELERGNLFNIFGGITRTDDVANGIVTATKANPLKVPIVIRLTGTNEEIAVKILQDNGFSASNDMDAAVQRAVELATKGGAA